jgi:endonuclease YncB( thermonuclease family)
LKQGGLTYRLWGIDAPELAATADPLPMNLRFTAAMRWAEVNGLAMPLSRL